MRIFFIIHTICISSGLGFHGASHQLATPSPVLRHGIHTPHLLIQSTTLFYYTICWVMMMWCSLTYIVQIGTKWLLFAKLVFRVNRLLLINIAAFVLRSSPSLANVFTRQSLLMLSRDALSYILFFFFTLNYSVRSFYLSYALFLSYYYFVFIGIICAIYITSEWLFLETINIVSPPAFLTALTPSFETHFVNHCLALVWIMPLWRAYGHYRTFLVFTTIYIRL